MREIKFRMWDTEYKRWENPDGIGLEDGVPFSATGDGYKDDVYTHYPEYVVQQYTGLKDRNGVEIYEGDIVRAGTVESNDGAVKDMNVPVEYVRGIFEPIAYLTDDVLEVIGNIYENPEFLEATK